MAPKPYLREDHFSGGRPPPPDVRLQSIDSDGVRYALRYWLERFDDEVDARDAVWRQVDLALRRAGATTPQQHITIHQSQPKVAAAGHTQRWLRKSEQPG